MEIPIRKLFLFLLAVIVFLLAMSFFPEDISWTITNRFDLDEEANVPTWFSTLLLFGVSVTSFLVHLRKDKDRFWLLFGSAYLFLSMDETARIHEWINIALFKWIWIYAPFAAVFFAVCVTYFVRNKDITLRNWVLGGMMVFALGGLFFETLYHLLSPLPPFVWMLEVLFEEGLEMTGTSMVLRGCLQEYQRLSSISQN